MNKRVIFFFLFILLIFSCKKKNDFNKNEIPNRWADLTTDILKTTPANSPTFASRSLGYIGLTMYESVAGLNDSLASMSGQLNGFLLEKTDTVGVNPLISLNEAQAVILQSIYIQTSDRNKARIDSLRSLIENEVLTNGKLTEKQVLASKNYGKKIALAVFEWSKSDGGHRAYLKNFDKKLKFSQRKGGWKPPLYGQSFSHYPLHPHWGENRTFLTKNNKLTDPKFIAYNDQQGSDYFNQFMEVYKKEKSLTQAEKEAAIYWGDDPDETPTPPGHSYYLATLSLRKSGASFWKCAETYAKVGISLADAFRNCWKWKYKYFTERPNTFIVEHIDSTWNSFWPDPPFPAFPSGHAIQAAAAATILTDGFGEKFSFTDSLHAGRRKDALRNVEFKARKFNSFWELAHETANSRFYGGIHCPQDNEAGLIKGKEIAENVLSLKWRKK